MFFIVWLLATFIISPLLSFILATAVWSVEGSRSIMDDAYLTGGTLIVLALSAVIIICPLIGLGFDGFDHLALWTSSFIGLTVYTTVVTLTPWYRRSCAVHEAHHADSKSVRSN